MKIKLSLFLLLILISASNLLAEEIDLNKYYRFPLSLGLRYQYQLRGYYNIEGPLTNFDLAFVLKKPLKAIPWIQPGVIMGFHRFNNNENESSETIISNHTHNQFSLLGEGALQFRLLRNLELGAFLHLGLGFDFLKDPLKEDDVDYYLVLNSLVEMGLSVVFNPVNKLSMEFQPILRYQNDIMSYDIFNGVSFSLGGIVHWRFGEDPDENKRIYKNIKIHKLTMDPVFAAMQSYYVSNSLGSFTISNIEDESLTDLEVSFYQARFMDSPTPIGECEGLAPGEKKEFSLFASYNDQIFKTQGTTPLTGELIFTYKYNGRSVEQRETVTYDLHDRNSIIWDDNRKVAAFITPSDNVIREYGGFIIQAGKKHFLPDFNKPLQTAMEIYSALENIDCMYQSDPRSPFENVMGEQWVLDNVSFARDTLKKITGDCDDLTVLFLSLLESMGVETGFITVPGHIFPVFNTGVNSRDYQKIHPQREMGININGSIWVPVEITQLGNRDFIQAWKSAIHTYSMENNKDRQFYFTREAHMVYRPLSLTTSEISFYTGDVEAIGREFGKNLLRLEKLILEDYEKRTKMDPTPRNFNLLGIAYHMFRHYDKAEASFLNALAIDPSYLSSRRNLGNLYYLQDNYEKALVLFEGIIEEIKERSEKKVFRLKDDLYLQTATIYRILGNQEKADELNAYVSFIEKAGDLNRSSEGNYFSGYFLFDTNEY